MRVQPLSFFLLALNAAAPAAPVVNDRSSPPSSEAKGNAGDVKKVASKHSSEAAIEAFNEGRYAEALRTIKPLAEKGDPGALLVMGVAYKDGLGVEASQETALEYLRKAKTSGNEKAAYLLPKLLIETGEAKARDEASRMLEDMAKTDKGAAAYTLGEGALRGWFGGDPDFEGARAWWLKSAKKGHVRSMLALARMFEGEFGFPEKRDPAAAMEQYLKAASLGNSVAMVAVGARLLSGDKSMDQKIGREWLKKAIKARNFDAYLVLGDFESRLGEREAALANYRSGAEKGQAVCMVKLANSLSGGEAGVEKDPLAALEWYRKAGESGVPAGHLFAARILLDEKDPSKVPEAYGRLFAAAQAGLAEAQNEIGVLYLTGRLGARDGTAAAAWFVQAANAGLPLGCYNLASLVERGYGVPQNFSEAGRLYTIAANSKHPQATAALGHLNAKGLGIKQNLPVAWALYKRAVELGIKDMEVPLGELTKDMTPEQIEEAEKQLAEFKKVGEVEKEAN